jgi:hypothetical protein
MAISIKALPHKSALISLTSLFWMSAFVFSFGQVAATASAIEKVETDSRPISLLKSPTGNLLLVRSEYEEKLGPGAIERCAIDVFSPDLKLIKQGAPKDIKRIDLEPETREWALQFGDVPSLMLAEVNRKEDKWDLFRAKISDEGVVGPQLKIGSLPGSYKYGELITYFSCDSSLMMVLYAPPSDKYRKDRAQPKLSLSGYRPICFL